MLLAHCFPFIYSFFSLQSSSISPGLLCWVSFFFIIFLFLTAKVFPSKPAVMQRNSGLRMESLITHNMPNNSLVCLGYTTWIITHNFRWLLPRERRIPESIPKLKSMLSIGQCRAIFHLKPSKKPSINWDYLPCCPIIVPGNSCH